jgi:glycosyltransferase involved in cell wall biosynthesis
MNGLSIAHTESSCGWGGQEIRVIEESAGLLRAGYQVVIAAPAESRIHSEAQLRGVPVVGLPIAKKSVSGLLSMRRFLSSHLFDVVNTHSSTDSWLVTLASRTLRSPPAIVRTRHISAMLRQTIPTRWLYRSARHVVTTGERLRGQVMESLGLPAEQVTSVPTGVDLARFSPGDAKSARSSLGLPMDAFVVGIVATLRSWKGHRYLIDAFARLDIPEARLVIVGGGPGEDNIRSQIEALGLTERTTLAGNQKDVVPWLRAMNVFALPSYANEGIPQAIMQAQACGVPVVSTDVGAIGEIITHGLTGWMVKPRDSVALSEGIAHLYANAGLRGELAENALSQARERFSTDIMLSRMAAIFESVAKRNSL